MTKYGMQKINYTRIFVFYNATGKKLSAVPCTEYEKIESAESINNKEVARITIANAEDINEVFKEFFYENNKRIGEKDHENSTNI